MTETTFESPAVSPIVTTNYTVSVDFGGDCTASDVVQVIVEPAPCDLDLILTAIDASCGLANGSAMLNVDGGTAPYSYAWQNEVGEILGETQNLSEVSGGVYTVTVMDNANCSTSAVVEAHRRLNLAPTVRFALATRWSSMLPRRQLPINGKTEAPPLFS